MEHLATGQERDGLVFMLGNRRYLRGQRVRRALSLPRRQPFPHLRQRGGAKAAQE